ncbi:hypothetical protein PRIPAC_82293, partial [Pristionchus pacificus]|uniref:G protein-coupled receptor n=1 Tax=Pristionchus pacificus TaxID=54126 RepID=A0A2A6CJN6_PRIPA
KVSWLIFYALLLNLHEIPTYSYSLAIGFAQEAYTEAYKHHRMVEAVRWSVVYFPDLFSSFTMSFSMFTALIYFLIMVGFRHRTIARFAHYEVKISSGTRSNQKMLHEALNIQLAASSFWFIGGTLFTINVIFEGTSPNFAHYTPSIINMQNISTPLTNLCIITPYRTFIVQFIRRQVNKISNVHRQVAVVTVNSI